MRIINTKNVTILVFKLVFIFYLFKIDYCKFLIEKLTFIKHKILVYSESLQKQMLVKI